MKDYKVAQEYYHRMHTPEEIGDYNLPHFEVSGNSRVMADGVISYLTKDWPYQILPQPIKSYAVALIYATLIVEHFNEDFYEVLSDPELLYGNDRWFKPYSEKTREIYDIVIRELPQIIDRKVPQTQATIEYFHKEFLSF